MTPTDLTQQQLRDRAATMSQDGFGDGEIAARLGLSVEIVRQWLTPAQPEQNAA